MLLRAMMIDDGPRHNADKPLWIGLRAYNRLCKKTRDFSIVLLNVLIRANEMHLKRFKLLKKTLLKSRLHISSRLTKIKALTHLCSYMCEGSEKHRKECREIIRFSAGFLREIT